MYFIRRYSIVSHNFFYFRRRKDHVLLSPVPENLLGGPDKTHPLDSGMHPMNVVRSSHNTDTSRSMETVRGQLVSSNVDVFIHYRFQSIEDKVLPIYIDHLLMDIALLVCIIVLMVCLGHILNTTSYQLVSNSYLFVYLSV